MVRSTKMAFHSAASMGQRLHPLIFAAVLLLAVSTSPCIAQQIPAWTACPSGSCGMNPSYNGTTWAPNLNPAVHVTSSFDGFASMPFQPNGYYSGNFERFQAAPQIHVLVFQLPSISPNAYQFQGPAYQSGSQISGRVRVRTGLCPTR